MSDVGRKEEESSPSHPPSDFAHPTLKKTPDSGGIASVGWAARGQASRYDDDISKLTEVMVEAECLGDAKFLDDPFAGAVRKAPVLIVVATKYFPGLLKLVGCQVMKLRERARQDVGPERRRSRFLAAHSEQRERLVHDVVCRDQRLSVLGKPSGSRRVIRVHRDEAGELGAGVNEDHLRSP
jgi:hypothetical protein